MLFHELLYFAAKELDLDEECIRDAFKEKEMYRKRGQRVSVERVGVAIYLSCLNNGRPIPVPAISRAIARWMKDWTLKKIHARVKNALIRLAREKKIPPPSAIEPEEMEWWVRKHVEMTDEEWRKIIRQYRLLKILYGRRINPWVLMAFVLFNSLDVSYNRLAEMIGLSTARLNKLVINLADEFRKKGVDLRRIFN